MTEPEDKKTSKRTSLNNWIVFCLSMSFVISFIGTFFSYQGHIQTFLFKVDGLFAISAFACLASKTTSEKFDLPAAGFTVLAIAQGMFLAEIDSPGKWDYETATTAALFMVPSFIMISYYTKFPRWLRILGLVMTIPFITLIIVRTFFEVEKTFALESVVYLAYQATTLCWAWQVYKET